MYYVRYVWFFYSLVKQVFWFLDTLGTKILETSYFFH